MASTINATTSSGIVATADNTGSLALQTSGTTAVTIDTSQNVGIGTTSPSYKLQVYGASNPEMRLGDATVTYQLYTEGATAAVMGTVGSHALVYRTNATERMRIDSSGNVLVGTSSVVPTETGVVIQQNNSTNHATVTYKYTANPSSSATVTFNTSSLGFSGSIQYCVEVTASAYGNSNTGVGTYKGMVTGFSGLTGSYQAVTNIVSAMTSTGSFTLAGGTNQVILTITNTNGSQSKFGVVRFDVTWGG